MKKRKIIQLYKAFEQVRKIGDSKFKYIILKNLKLISDEISVLKELEQPIGELIIPIHEQKDEIIKKLGASNKDGSISIDVKDTEKTEQFTKEMQVVLDKNKNIIEKYNAEMKKYEEILEEQIEQDFEFYSIHISDCPNDLDDNILELFMDFEIIK